MTSKQFEEKYNIETFNAKWMERTSVVEYEKKSKVTSFSGKPTKVWQDIIRRFFKNKWNVLFLTILIALIVEITIGSTFTKYSAGEKVTNTKLASIAYLHPISNVSKITPTNNIQEIESLLKLNNITPTQDANGAWYLDDYGKNVIVSSEWKYNLWFVKFKNPAHVTTILGTDASGVSVWQRLITSSRFSFSLAIIVATIETILGTIVGLYLGFHAGKWIDTYFMRVVEIIRAIPALLLIVIFVIIFGGSFSSFLISLVIIGWIGPVYVTRMYTIKVKDAEYIQASTSIGARKSRLIFRHVLPAIFGRLMVGFVQRIPIVIFAEATIVFLGISVGDGNTLGSILEESRHIDAMNGNPLFLYASAGVLLTFTLSLQIIANGLRDAFDSKVSG